jgi:hypothetical protein
VSPCLPCLVSRERCREAQCAPPPPTPPRSSSLRVPVSAPAAVPVVLTNQRDASPLPPAAAPSPVSVSVVVSFRFVSPVPLPVALVARVIRCTCPCCPGRGRRIRSAALVSAPGAGTCRRRYCRPAPAAPAVAVCVVAVCVLPSLCRLSSLSARPTLAIRSPFRFASSSVSVSPLRQCRASFSSFVPRADRRPHCSPVALRLISFDVASWRSLVISNPLQPRDGLLVVRPTTSGVAWSCSASDRAEGCAATATTTVAATSDH